MRAFVLLAACLLTAGCAQPADPEPAWSPPASADGEDPFAAEADRVARAADAIGPIDLQVIAWETVELDALSAVTLPIGVPYALRLMVLWQADEGVYTGPVRWSGLEGCDGLGGAAGPTATLGRNGGSSSVSCAAPAPGTYDLTVELEAGRVTGTFIVVAVVPAPEEQGNATTPPPSA